MKKYVIAGGPSIGKTTIIEILARMGYKIIPESARIIIEEERLKGSDILPWKNSEKFQEKVAQRQIESEEGVNGDLFFLDRSIIDGHAYSKINKSSPPEIIEKFARDRYDKIFILDPLEKYERDGTRHENEEEAKIAHNEIINAYKHFGYEIISVPVLAPEDRVKFILDHIN